jgi:hypothetical protein
MTTVRFTDQGHDYEWTDEQVRERLRDETPRVIRDHAVEVEGRWFPVRQAFALPLDRNPAHVNTHVAKRQLERLGFKTHHLKFDGPLPLSGATEMPASSTREDRVAVLQLAVAVHRGAATTADEVIATAESFEDWLSA